MMTKRNSLALVVLFVFVMAFSMTASFVTTAKACIPPALGCCEIVLHGGQVVGRGHWVLDPEMQVLYCETIDDGSCCIHQ